jgi:hypothetical protein
MVGPNRDPRPLDQDRPLWERQRDESKLAYDAFRVYLDDHTRRVGRSSTRDWHKIWSWATRAYEFDNYMARKDIEDRVRYQRQMNERQRSLAALILERVRLWVEHTDPFDWNATQAARLMLVASRVERLAGGDVTERTEIQAREVGDIAGLPAEQVEAELKRLVDKIKAGVPNPADARTDHVDF